MSVQEHSLTFQRSCDRAPAAFFPFVLFSFFVTESLVPHDKPTLYMFILKSVFLNTQLTNQPEPLSKQFFCVNVFVFGLFLNMLMCWTDTGEVRVM